MFRSVGYTCQEDRSKHCTEAKSCLTLESSPSDNGLIRLRHRRNSMCGLQLDGFSGAMQWSHCTNAELIDALWSGAFSPRAADQTDLPVIAGLCVQPCFRIRKCWAPRLHFAQSSSCEIFALPVFTNIELGTASGRSRGAVALRRVGVAASKEFIRLRHVELVEVPLLQSLEFAVEETSSCC